MSNMEVLTRISEKCLNKDAFNKLLLEILLDPEETYPEQSLVLEIEKCFENPKHMRVPLMSQEALAAYGAVVLAYHIDWYPFVRKHVGDLIKLLETKEISND